jgi:hypothetical protein
MTAEADVEAVEAEMRHTSPGETAGHDQSGKAAGRRTRGLFEHRPTDGQSLHSSQTLSLSGGGGRPVVPSEYRRRPLVTSSVGAFNSPMQPGNAVSWVPGCQGHVDVAG